MLTLQNNFFTNFCDENKFEEMEMDTDSLYLALAEKELEDCVRLEMKTKWEQLRSKYCTDSFTADAAGNLSPRMCRDKHKKFDKRKPGLFKEEFRCTEMLCLCSKTYCCFAVVSNKFKVRSKSFNKRVLEQSIHGVLNKYCLVRDEKVNFTSINRGCCTNNDSDITYEQVRKILSYFYPKRRAVSDGFHTQPLNS